MCYGLLSMKVRKDLIKTAKEISFSRYYKKLAEWLEEKLKVYELCFNRKIIHFCALLSEY